MGLSDSSELQEAASLLQNFRSRGRVLGGRSRAVSSRGEASPTLAPRAIQPASISSAVPPAVHQDEIPQAYAKAPPARQAHSSENAESKGGRIEEILESMCLRGGFHGAVVADEGGLAVAEYNCPVETDAVAACSSVLGSAMERAGRLLEQQEANHMTMDINYVDKVVLRQFAMEKEPYFLMIICPQEVDERSELEISIDRVAAVLARRN
jgi:predicted regulator of Ras-like GTPase activity (Roadblock/LC7/MglB family)